MRGDFVTATQCKLCQKWKVCIKTINGTDTWVWEGSKCVEKKKLKIHLESALHKKAADYEKIKNFGIEKYTEKVIDETPIGKGLKQMGTDDEKTLVKFNTAHYFAKNERLFSSYPELLELQEKKGVWDTGKADLNDKKCAKFTKYI